MMEYAVFRLMFYLIFKNNEKKNWVFYNSILLSKFANSNIYKKMKQLKFLMVAFTLLMGVSLTSCMNDNSNYTPTVAGFAKVNSIYGSASFKLLDGTTVTPTYSSLAALSTTFKPENTNMAYIQGTYDESIQTSSETNKVIKDVNLSYGVSLDDKVIITEKGAENDSVNKAPIITMDLSSQYGVLYKPWFFDKNTLMLPINYYLSNDGHAFSLVYYPADDNSTLKLYLRHYNHNKDIATGNKSVELSGNRPYLYFFAYDLSEVFNMNEGIPAKIEVEVEENSYDASLEKAETKVYTIDCKPIMEK